jgi:hypothetical protein
MDNNYKKTIIKDNLNSDSNLYKLVDNLKNKLAKLEAFCKTNIHQQKNITHIQRANQTILSSYRIFYPKITKK